jgi:hypothetical protein
MIETAKANSLNPFGYLTHILKTAPNLDLKNPGHIERLMPWNAPPECAAGKPKAATDAEATMSYVAG